MVISTMSNLFGVKMSLWLKDPKGRTLSDEDILHYPYDSSNLSRNHENKEEKTTFSQWQEGFFEEVIGGWEGELLVREKQPDYEEREQLL